MGMIEFKKCAVIDGVAYVSLDEAKKAKLIAIFDSLEKKPWTPLEIATHILDQTDSVLDALTLSYNSRPVARKVNGGSKPRKKAPASPAYSDIARLEEVASQVQTEAQRVLQAQ